MAIFLWVPRLPVHDTRSWLVGWYRDGSHLRGLVMDLCLFLLELVVLVRVVVVEDVVDMGIGGLSLGCLLWVDHLRGSQIDRLVVVRDRVGALNQPHR